MGAAWEPSRTKAPQLGLEKPEPHSNYVIGRENQRSLWQCWGAELGVFMLAPKEAVPHSTRLCLLPYPLQVEAVNPRQAPQPPSGADILPVQADGLEGWQLLGAGETIVLREPVVPTLHLLVSPWFLTSSLVSQSPPAQESSVQP